MPLHQILDIPCIPRLPRWPVPLTMLPMLATLPWQGTLVIKWGESISSLSHTNIIIRPVVSPAQSQSSLMTTFSTITCQTLMQGGLLTGAKAHHPLLLLLLPQSLFMWITTARMITAPLRYRGSSITLILLRSMIGQRVMQVALYLDNTCITLC